MIPGITGSSSISADANRFSPEGTGNGGSITIGADTVSVLGGSISTDAGGVGRAGSIFITADIIDLDASSATFANISANSGTGIDETGTGDGGSIDIVVGELTIDRGIIASEARGFGDGGSISIIADRIDMQGLARIDSSSDPLVTDSAAGNAGSITIDTGELSLSRATIVSNTVGAGNARTIDITADSTVMTFFSSIDSTTNGSGNGGALILTTGTLDILDSSLINSSTTAQGNADVLTINAGDIYLDTLGFNNFTGIASQAGSSATGNAGAVVISADTIDIRDGAIIDSSMFGAGDAASVIVQTDTLTISGDGAVTFTGIASSAVGNQSSGDAGVIDVTANDIQLVNGGAISSETAGLGDAGAISINAQNFVLPTGGLVDSSTFGAGNAGTVSIMADTLTMSGDAGIFSTATNPNFDSDAGEIEVTSQSISLTEGAGITSSTFSDGDAGSVTIDTGTLVISGRNIPGDFTGITSSTINDGFTGDAGEIVISADEIDVMNSGEISSSTNNEGNAGSVTINADRLTVDGEQTRIASETRAPGDAGQLILDIGDLEILNDALVSSTTIGSGAGGSINLTADTLLIDGGSLASGTVSGVPDAGDGGSITVNAGDIEVLNGGLMTVSTRSTGDGGSITVDADTILIDGTNERGQTSQIDSQTFVAGKAGSVFITADTINTNDSGRIVGSTTGMGTAGSVEVNVGDLTISGAQSGISSDSAFGAMGDAGSVTVTADTIDINNNAIISTSVLNPGMAASGSITVTADDISLSSGAGISTSNNGRGLGGDIDITATNFFSLSDGRVTTTAATGDGGRITLSGGVVDQLNSEISTSVGGAGGAGGDININNTVIVQDNSTIRANAVGGDGGNINITVDQLIQHPGRIAAIEATSALGISGDINVSTPETDAVGGLVVLSGDFLDDTAILDEPYETRIGGGATSSLVPTGRGGLPAGPDDPGSASYFGAGDLSLGPGAQLNVGPELAQLNEHISLGL